jgi:hypothetical protein
MALILIMTFAGYFMILSGIHTIYSIKLYKDSQTMNSKDWEGCGWGLICVLSKHLLGQAKDNYTIH